MKREERRLFQCLGAAKRKRCVKFLHGDKSVVINFEPDTADVVRKKNLPRVERLRELFGVTDDNLTITIEIGCNVRI